MINLLTIEEQRNENFYHSADYINYQKDSRKFIQEVAAKVDEKEKDDDTNTNDKK